MEWSAQSAVRSGHTDDSGVHKVQLGLDILMTVGVHKVQLGLDILMTVECTKYRQVWTY